MRFTREQRGALGKFLYESTEVTVTVNTPRDKVVELATELNVTSKRIAQWINNQKRVLKPELFRIAAFQASGILDITSDPKIKRVTKPRESMKRERPAVSERPLRSKAQINKPDTTFMTKLLNFEEAEMPNVVPENKEETSFQKERKPCDAEHPTKKIKIESQSSINSFSEWYDSKLVSGGIEKMNNGSHSKAEESFNAKLMNVDYPGGLETPLLSQGNLLDSIAKSSTLSNPGNFAEISAAIPGTMLFPSFLTGLPANSQSTPTTPYSSVIPKLEVQTPLGRPPPCVGGIDEPVAFGFVQQPTFKTETSKRLPYKKKRGNPVIRSNSKGGRRKFNDNQLLILESFYTANLFTGKEVKETVAQSAGLTYKQVKIWIKNRKVRDKKGLPSLLPKIQPSTARGFSETQRRILTAFFQVGFLDKPSYREAIAKATGLTEKQIKIWRKNTRAKMRKAGKLP